MIREIIVDIREGDDSVRKRILGAIVTEIGLISLENGGIDPEFFGGNVDQFEAVLDDGLPKFPGHVVINVFDENEELMEIIET